MHALHAAAISEAADLQTTFERIPEEDLLERGEEIIVTETAAKHQANADVDASIITLRSMQDSLHTLCSRFRAAHVRLLQHPVVEDAADLALFGAAAADLQCMRSSSISRGRTVVAAGAVQKHLVCSFKALEVSPRQAFSVFTEGDVDLVRAYASFLQKELEVEQRHLLLQAALTSLAARSSKVAPPAAANGEATSAAAAAQPAAATLGAALAATAEAPAGQPAAATAAAPGGASAAADTGINGGLSAPESAAKAAADAAADAAASVAKVERVLDRAASVAQQLDEHRWYLNAMKDGFDVAEVQQAAAEATAIEAITEQQIGTCWEELLSLKIPREDLDYAGKRIVRKVCERTSERVDPMKREVREMLVLVKQMASLRSAAAKQRTPAAAARGAGTYISSRLGDELLEAVMLRLGDAESFLGRVSVELERAELATTRTAAFNYLQAASTDAGKAVLAWKYVVTKMNSYKLCVQLGQELEDLDTRRAVAIQSLNELLGGNIEDDEQQRTTSKCNNALREAKEAATLWEAASATATLRTLVERLEDAAYGLRQKWGRRFR